MEIFRQTSTLSTTAEAGVRDEFDRPYSGLAQWVGRLITPHPLASQETTFFVQQEEDINSIESWLDIAGSREALSMTRGEELDYVRLVIADEVSRVVKVTLAFWPGRQDEKTGHLVRPSLEQISSEQKANCYGFTLVTSALLEKIGIEHSIGFANGHAFIVLFKGNGKQTTAHLIDSVEPYFNQDMISLQPATSFEEVREQMERSGRGATTISTSNFAQHLNLSVQDLVNDGHWRWLMHKPKAGESLTEAEAFKRHTQLELTIFRMAEGRRALEDNLGYLNARATGD